jgi:serine O-acetyltransferase
MNDQATTAPAMYGISWDPEPWTRRPAFLGDVHAMLDTNGVTPRGPRGIVQGLMYIVLKPGLQATGLYRLARWFGRRRVPAVPELLCLLAYYLTGCEISARAEIGVGLVIQHAQGIVVHGDAVLGRHVKLLSGVVIGERPGQQRQGAPTIGDHVTIGTGAKLLGAIDVGDWSAIGANAVVLDDVPAHSSAVGIPARVRPRGGR